MSISPEATHFTPHSALPKAERPTFAPAAMRTSIEGRQFIIRQEGSAPHLYSLPDGTSGVTLGHGYDMAKRKEGVVASDLQAIQVPAPIAALAAKGAGKHGQDAKTFADANRNLLNLSTTQQADLLNFTIGEYEGYVQKGVKIRLTQAQFDALVSFCYNPAGRWGKVHHLLNMHQIEAAMAVISSALPPATDKHGNPSKTRKGVQNRRKNEVNLFMLGLY